MLYMTNVTFRTQEALVDIAPSSSLSLTVRGKSQSKLTSTADAVFLVGSKATLSVSTYQDQDGIMPAFAGQAKVVATADVATVVFNKGQYALKPDQTLPATWVPEDCVVKKMGATTIGGETYYRVDVVQGIGVGVDGVDIAYGSGTGWTYESSKLTLDPAAKGSALTVSGVGENGSVHVWIASAGTVELADEFALTGSSGDSMAPVTVTNDVTLYFGNDVRLTADTYSQFPAIEVLAGATLHLSGKSSGNLLTAKGGIDAADVGGRMGGTAGTIVIGEGRYVVENRNGTENIGKGYNGSVTSVRIEDGHFSSEPNAAYAESGMTFSEHPDLDSACPWVLLANTGVTVDGVDVITGSGEGWIYDTASDTLTLLGSYSSIPVVAGASSTMQITVNADLKSAKGTKTIKLKALHLTGTASLSTLYSAEIRLLESSDLVTLTVGAAGKTTSLKILTEAENPANAGLALGTVSESGTATLTFASGYYGFAAYPYPDSSPKASWLASGVQWDGSDVPAYPWTPAGSNIQVRKGATTETCTTLVKAFDRALRLADGSTETVIASYLAKTSLTQDKSLPGSVANKHITLQFSASGTAYGNSIVFDKQLTVGDNVRLTVQGYGCVSGSKTIATTGSGVIAIPCEVNGSRNRITFGSAYTNAGSVAMLNGWITGDRRQLYEFVVRPGATVSLSQKMCRVTFENYGKGLRPADQELQCGNLVDDPGDLTCTNYLFRGWFADAGFTDPWDFETRTVSNLSTTIHAKWERDVHFLPPDLPGPPVGPIYPDDPRWPTDVTPESHPDPFYEITPTNTTPDDGPIYIPDNIGSNYILNLSGQTLVGTNGVHGTAYAPGTDGGPALVVFHSVTNEILNLGTTKLRVYYGQLVGGNGGNGHPAGCGAPAWTNLSGTAAVEVWAGNAENCKFIRGSDGKDLNPYPKPGEDPKPGEMTIRIDKDEPLDAFGTRLAVFGPGEAPHGCAVSFDAATSNVYEFAGEKDGPKNVLLYRNGVTNAHYASYRAYANDFAIPAFDPGLDRTVDNAAAGRLAAVVAGITNVSGSVRVSRTPTASGARKIVAWVEENGKADWMDFVRVTADGAIGGDGFLTVYLPYLTNGLVNVVRCTDGGAVSNLPEVVDASVATEESFSFWSGKMMLHVKTLGDFAFVNELGRPSGKVSASPYFIESLTNAPAVAAYMATSSFTSFMAKNPGLSLSAAPAAALAAAPAANGQLSVLATYAAGLDPSDENAAPRITSIEIGSDGKPVITYEPEALNPTLIRTTTLGVEKLGDEWQESSLVPNARFFRVLIEPAK